MKLLKITDEIINFQYNKNNLNKKETNFNQREYTLEDFEKLYANSQWKNNE
mgnify:CR=1 FL=1